MSFGYALRKFREVRGLSLRELGTLCGIDHAYIHRLEKDEKTAPSEDVIQVLARNLKLNARRTRMLGFLVGKNADGALVDLFLEEEDRPVEVFESLATMSFRGRRPDSKDEWRKLAERVKEFVV
jgi:transcriptional regulator with XRE-family HTH domain